MLNGELNALIHKHYYELIASYPGLKLEKINSDIWSISGLLTFSATYEREKIEDEYDIELIISKEYPKEPPIAKEKGGRIPKDFHTNHNYELCLGAPFEIRRKFAQKPTLIGFVEECVIPFFYSFSYHGKHGEMPFGELSHGGKGILEFYHKLLEVDNELIVLKFIKILIDNNYRGHHDCPCGSGLRLRQCHGMKLLEIKKYQKQDDFMDDYFKIAEYIVKTLNTKLPNELAPKRIKTKAIIRGEESLTV